MSTRVWEMGLDYNLVRVNEWKQHIIKCITNYYLKKLL